MHSNSKKFKKPTLDFKKSCFVWRKFLLIKSCMFVVNREYLQINDYLKQLHQ